MRAIITGTSLLDSQLLKGNEESVKTEYGSVEVVRIGKAVLLNRHQGNRPPHAIGWKANAAALKELGVNEAIGVSSVGSMKREIRPGMFFVVGDFIDFNPVTIFGEEIRHIVPAMDGELKGEIKRVLEKTGAEWAEGVYWQSRGPRLETKAEIDMMRNYADVAGMTVGSEATVCMETDISYAALCTVDNYAHGIGEAPSYESIRRRAAENMRNTEGVVNELINQER